MVVEIATFSIKKEADNATKTFMDVGFDIFFGTGVLRSRVGRQ